MYVFSLVLCLWDAPNKSGKRKRSNKMLFFYSILPLCCCFFSIRAYSQFSPLRASVSRPPVMLVLPLLLSGRTG